jgi:hypothetical protein
MLAVTTDVAPVAPTPLPVKAVTAFPLPSVVAAATDKVPTGRTPVTAKLTVTPLTAISRLFFTFAVTMLFEALVVSFVGLALTVMLNAAADEDAVRVMRTELVEPLLRTAWTISSTFVPETFAPALYVTDISVYPDESCIGIGSVETLAPLEPIKLAPLLFIGMIKVIVSDETSSEYTVALRTLICPLFTVPNVELKDHIKLGLVLMLVPAVLVIIKALIAVPKTA